MPIPRAVASDLRTYWAAVGLVSRTRISILARIFNQLCHQLNRFAITSPLMLVMPVILPPGRAKVCA